MNYRIGGLKKEKPNTVPAPLTDAATIQEF